MPTNMLESYKLCRGLLCGPMEGLPDHNYPAFYAAASVLRSEGYEISSPAGILGGDTTLGREAYMRETLRLVMNSYFLVVLPGWRDSLGAMTEVAVARALGTPVFDYVTRQEVAQQKQEAVDGALFIADMHEDFAPHCLPVPACFDPTTDGDGEDEVDYDEEDYGGEVEEDCDCGECYQSEEPAPRQSEDRFDQVLDEIRAMRVAKRADYADSEDQFSNFRRAERLGVSAFLGCLVRMSDKWERITQLSQNPPMVRNESIIDTLRDLSCYAIIASILREQEVAAHVAVEIEQFSAMDQDDIPF